MKKWDFNDSEEVANDVPQIDYRKIVDKVVDNWSLFITCLVIAMIIAFATNRYTTPIYVVSANMLIKSEKENTNAVADLLYGEEFFGRNSTNLENEAVLFKARTLIRTTLEDLNLDVSYYAEGDVKDAELYDRSPISVELDYNSNRFDFKSLFKCTMLSNQKFSLDIVDERSILDKVIEKIAGTKSGPKIDNTVVYALGDTVKIGSFRFFVKPLEEGQKLKGKVVLFRFHNYKKLAKSYRSNLEVDPISEDASIMKISMKGAIPAKTINFINTIMDNYISNELDRKNASAAKTIDFINKQIVYMSDSLSLIEDRLESFKMSNSAIDLSEEATKLYNASASLVTEKSTLGRDIKYLMDLEGYIQRDDLDQIITPSSLGINDQSLNSLIQQLTALQADIKIMESDRGLENPMIRLTKQKINALKGTILENVRSMLATNQYRLQDVERRLSGVQGSLGRLPSAERELFDIERTHQLNEDLYLFLLQKKAEAGIAKATNTVDYRIVDRAEVQGVAPVKPSPILNYMVAVFLGLIIPAVFLFVKTLISNKITSKEDVMNITKMPLVGLVAHNKVSGALITQHSPKSAIAESFRTIRSNLRYMSNGQEQGTVFLITSSVSGEGKSFISSNLAYIFSNFGKKVILINADMRKHYSNEAFGLQGENGSVTYGLSDYLAGIASKEHVIKQTKFKNYDMIVAGGIPPNPSELLLAGRFEQLLIELRKEYDYIFLDTPPVGLLADGLELMSRADINLFVVRQGYSLKAHVMEADEHYRTGRYKHMSVLINDVKFKKLKYGYGYYEEDRGRGNWKLNILSKKKDKVTVG